MRNKILFMAVLIMISGVSGVERYFLNPGSNILGYSRCDIPPTTYAGAVFNINEDLSGNYVYSTVEQPGTYYFHIVNTDLNGRLICGVTEAGVQMDCVTTAVTDLGGGKYLHEATTNTSSYEFEFNSRLFDTNTDVYYASTYYNRVADGNRTKVYYYDDYTIRVAGTVNTARDDISAVVYSEFGGNNDIDYYYNISTYYLNTTLNPCSYDGTAEIWVSYYENGSSDPDTWDLIPSSTRKSALYFETHLNEDAFIDSAPQQNTLDTEIDFEDLPFQDFEVLVGGYEIDSIAWTLRKYQDSTIIKTGSGYTFTVFGDQLGAGCHYVLTAKIIDVCDQYADILTWYMFKPMDTVSLSGYITRQNETDIWPVTNGSIYVGTPGEYFDGYLLESNISTGDYAIHYIPQSEYPDPTCYPIYIYDYDIEGNETNGTAIVDGYSFCFYGEDRVQNWNIPTTYSSDYSITACLYDETEGTQLYAGGEVILWRDPYGVDGRIDTQLTNASGCVVFEDIFYKECVYIHWEDWEDYNPVTKKVCITNRSNETIQINISISPDTDISFTAWEDSGGYDNPLDSVRIECIREGTNETVYGWTNDGGLVYLSLRLAQDYSCEATRTYYSPAHINITDLERDDSFEVRLSPLVPLYDFSIFCYDIVNKTTFEAIDEEIIETIPLGDVSVVITCTSNPDVETFTKTIKNGVYSGQLPIGDYVVAADREGYLLDRERSDLNLYLDENHPAISLYFEEYNALSDLWSFFQLDLFGMSDENKVRGVLWRIVPVFFVLLIIVLSASTLVRKTKQIKDDLGF